MLSSKAGILALLVALWIRPGVVSVTHGPGCLYKNSTFIACYATSGVLTLGDKGGLDGAYRPMAHDVFTLVNGAAVERAPLRGRVVLPVVRR